MCQKIYIIDSKGSYTILLSQYSWSQTTFTYFTPELAEYTTRLNLQINNTAINMSHILKIPIHTHQALSITHKTISTINKLQCTYSTFLKKHSQKNNCTQLLHYKQQNAQKFHTDKYQTKRIHTTSATTYMSSKNNT